MVAAFEKWAAREHLLTSNPVAPGCSGLKLSRAARPGRAETKTCERPLLSYMPVLGTPRSHSERPRDKRGVVEENKNQDCDQYVWALFEAGTLRTASGLITKETLFP